MTLPPIMLKSLESSEPSQTSILQNSSNIKEPESYLDLSKYSSSQSNMNKNINSYNFKVILLGDSSVGKTSIFTRFLAGKFDENYKCTVGTEYKLHSIYPDLNTEVNLHVWDTAGSEKYKSITKQYYRDAHGIILIYDIANRKSFNNLNNWIEDIKDNSIKDCQIVIVGNKSDINNRNVSNEEGVNFANKLGLNYIESSAKNGTNVLLIFDVISKKMIKVFKEEEKTNDESIRVVKQSLSLNNELFLQKQKKLIQNIKEQEQKKTSCC